MSTRSHEINLSLVRFNSETDLGELRALLKLMNVLHPSQSELEFLRENAAIIAAVGLSEELIAAVNASRAAFPELVEQIETLVNLMFQPVQAAVTLKSMAFHDTMRGLDVINACNRGDLAGGILAAESQGWFLEDADLPHALAYSVWLLLMMERSDEADVLADTWRERHFGKSPRGDYQILQVQALLASAKDDFTLAVRLLEEAEIVARSSDFSIEAMFVQARLVSAYAQAGQEEAARELSSAWPPFDENSKVDAVRALARAEISIIAGDWSAAEEATDFLLMYHRRNPIYRIYTLFLRTISASEDTFESRFNAFSEAVPRHPSRRMLRRFADLDRLVQAGLCNPRTAEVVFISKTRKVHYGLARVWFPPAVQKTGVFVDCVRKMLFFHGRGPFEPRVCPRRFDVLVAVLKAPDMKLSVADTFQLVWGMPYDAGRHENKVHVTVHRLRRQLDELVGEPLHSIRIRDGFLEMHPDIDCFILDFPTASEASLPSQSLTDQIAMTLKGSVILPPRELEALLRVGRSTLRAALQEMQANGVVEKVGKGRSTCYRLCVESDD